MANMKVNLKIWRQADPKAQGGFVTYENVETDSDTSFLETLDILNIYFLGNHRKSDKSAAVIRAVNIKLNILCANSLNHIMSATHNNICNRNR